LEFIIGHEYAHHILDHLQKERLKKAEASKVFMGYRTIEISYYDYVQKLEFEADWSAIRHAAYGADKKERIVNAAFTFFLALDLFETVRGFLQPQRSEQTTHPPPMKRLRILRRRVDKSHGWSQSDLNRMIKMLADFKRDLIEIILPVRKSTFEFHGSIYLPSYKTRMLTDRVDF
jgi:hypothetical protein